jgi:hypothetical protein
MKKITKVIIFLVVFLTAAGIVAFKVKGTNSINFISNSNSIAYMRTFSFDNPVKFAFGQSASKTTLTDTDAIEAVQNLGEYVSSLDELNIIAINNDAVFIFIPGPENVLVDDKTKEAVFGIQNSLKRGNTTIGLYTLWYDSTAYSEIAKQTKLPAIVIARKGKGTITIPGTDVNEYVLLQAYRKAEAEGCCEFYSLGCC